MPEASPFPADKIVTFPDGSHRTAWETSESSRLEPAALPSGATDTARVMWNVVPMPSSSVMV